MKTAPARKTWGALTVRVALLADPVHSAVGVDAQEEAPFLQYSRLGSLKWPGGSAAAAVLRQGWQRGDAPGGHGPTKALAGSLSPCAEPRGEPPRPGPGLRRIRGAALAPAPQPPPRGTRPRPRAPSLELFGRFLSACPRAWEPGGPGSGVRADALRRRSREGRLP